MRFRSRATAADSLKEAQELLFSRRWDLHMAFVARAVARFPDNRYLRLEHAVALKDTNPEQALREAQHSVTLGPTVDAVLLTRTAALLIALGDIASAKTCVDAALRTGPEHAVVTSHLSAVQGQIAGKQGDFQAAETHLRAAHEAAPSNGGYARDLAAVMAAAGRYRDALGVIDRMLGEIGPATAGYASEDRAMLEELREAVERDSRNAGDGSV